MTDPVTSERELIETYLAPLARGAAGALGLTDDAAVISPPPGTSLVVSTDPIVAGVHFFADERADDIAWKALAVNVSDLAAKGAEPLAYTMALAFPAPPERAWIELFAKGLASAQLAFGCHLIGGDTDRTPGPLGIGITAIGVLPEGTFVRRNGARPGDEVFVTGTLGDAALGLHLYRREAPLEGVLTEGDASFLLGRYLRPSPRLALAPVLREFASAALDISDGFLKDMRRLIGPMGLTVAFDTLPLSPSARACADRSMVIDAVLAGGDDYELLVSVPTELVHAFVSEAARVGVAVTSLGRLTAEGYLRILGRDGTEITPTRTGYDHLAP